MKLAYLSLVALLLCSCSTVPQTPTVVAQNVSYPDVSVPPPQQITTQGFQWKIYNGRDIQELAKTIQTTGKDDVLIFGLTPNGYRALSHNMIELQRYIKQQQKIIVYLKTTIHNRSQ